MQGDGGAIETGQFVVVYEVDIIAAGAEGDAQVGGEVGGRGLRGIQRRVIGRCYGGGFRTFHTGVEEGEVGRRETVGTNAVKYGDEACVLLAIDLREFDADEFHLAEDMGGKEIG